MLLTYLCYITIFAVLLLFWYLKKEKEFWSRLGIPYFKPIPLLGNFYRKILKISSGGDEIKRIYSESDGYKCYGFYSTSDRFILIRDPAIIKQLTIKDFDYFQDHMDTVFKKDPESVFSKGLFALKGNQWRRMRMTLSPAFTGSKLRGIFTSMIEYGEQFSSHFIKEYDRRQSKGTPLELELSDVFTKFTNDVIATSAFGIKVNSLEDPNNIFYKMGQDATSFSITRILGVFFLPWLTRWLNIGFVSSEVTNFFNDLVKQSINARKKENITRPDMIHLLMEARKDNVKKEKQVDDNVIGFATAKEYLEHNEKEKLELTDSDIAAQAFLFFLGGFKTVSTSMCFTTMELAINVEIQRRLQEEIDKTMKQCNGKFTYDELSSMKYLDMVVSEGLRKWPPFTAIDRQCVKPYNLQLDEKVIHLATGQAISIPIFGLHWDSQYYPNPSKFDPERFSEERKENINSSTYLPFGSGPRNCIGSRLALMEIKIALIYLFANFNVDVVEKTQVPIVLGTKTFDLSIDNGFWVGLTSRNKS